MNYKEYTIRVYDNGTKVWHKGNRRHREDGPAVEYCCGSKAWYLNGVELTEEQFNQRMKKRNKVDSKIILIDGKTNFFFIKF